MLRCTLLLFLMVLSQVSPAGESGGSTTAAQLFSDAEWSRNSTVVGAPAASPAPGRVGSEVPVGPSIAALLGGLVLVIGLAVALGWAAKRLGMRRLIQGRGKHLTVIETVPIGFKRQATLLRIGDQVVLIGLGEHECCHLGTFAAATLGAAPSEPSPTVAPITPSAFAIRNLSSARPFLSK